MPPRPPNPGGSRPSSYRPEIDGLRAVAVLAVVVFHLDRHWLPGGFAGVDVFFVISGFLISSILLGKHESGRISFLQFYQRRIARLFPALLATTVATLLAARLLYSTWDYANTGAAFSASIFSIANFHLLLQGDYFELSLDAQPLLHFWSLAVEEQFYLLFPLFFYFVLKTSPKNRMRWLGFVTGASFLCGIILTQTHPTWAFYMLPARVWELLVGSLLAVSMRRKHPGLTDHRIASAGSWLGLSMILGSFLWLQEGPQFPGWIAAIPVAGTALILRWSVSGKGKALLSWAPLVAVGRASYSIYLWHWPIFSLIDYSLAFESFALRFTLKIVLTLLLSWASYRWLERPCRVALNLPKNRMAAYALLGLAVIALGPLGYGIRKTHYIDASDGKENVLLFPQAGASETLMIMGDSQATMYSKLMREIAEERRARLVVLSIAGRDPLAHAEGAPPSAVWSNCLKTVRQEKPRCLVLACHWYKLRSDPSRLASTVKALEPHVEKLILFTMPPQLPEAADRKSIRQGSRPPFFEDPGDAGTREELNALVKACAGGKVRLLEVDPFLTKEDGELIVYGSNGESLFQDRVHLTGAGADRLRPALEALLDD